VKERSLKIADDDEEPLAGISEQPMKSQIERAEVQARFREHRAAQDRTYQRLLDDAQACARAMRAAPLLDNDAAWEAAVVKAADDLRSGRALMDQLGADRLIDPTMAGRLLALRRGLIDDTNASSAGDFILIDMAVIAYANGMRLEAMVGNQSLLIEAELFGQPSLNAKWKDRYGGPEGDAQRLAVEDQVRLLRDRLLPLVERFHRMARESVAAIAGIRRAPNLRIERDETITIVFHPPEQQQSKI
jgi:hypothetical protein